MMIKETSQPYEYYGSITKPVGFGVAVIVPPAGIE